MGLSFWIVAGEFNAFVQMLLDISSWKTKMLQFVNIYMELFCKFGRNLLKNFFSPDQILKSTTSDAWWKNTCLFC